jgi:NAD(P)-dependent dehydrogenase (short-subunit alcohol dehydrogenase family)
MRLKPIEEQVVVVFGASSGIGRAAALRFARQGARVVVAARSGKALEGLAQEIRAAGGEAVAISAEASDPDQVQALADQAAATYGRIDCWVQLAGVGLWALFAETTPEEWRRVIDVNLNGTAYAAMAALPHLKRSGGALILVSSSEANVGMPYQGAYAASKHGIHGLVKALRLEIRHEKLPISLTEIMPSGINTPLFDKTRTKIGTKPMPPPPLYEPEIAANAILYAAEHSVPELFVGGSGLLFSALRRASRGLADGLVSLAGFALQHTPEAKPDGAPDNLDQHLPGHDQVRGSLEPVTRHTSATTWLSTHPAACRALTGALLGSAALIAYRAMQGGTKDQKGPGD